MLVCFHTASPAQEPVSGGRADVPALIKRLKDDKEDVAGRAAGDLLDIGQPAVLPLRAFLEKEKGCRPRVLAASVLTRLAPDSEVIASSMLEVLKDGCSWSPQKDMILRQHAAYVLAETPAGVRALAGLLKGRSVFGRFERRSAVFAFDELTEKIEGVRPDSVAPTPELLGALKDAIPSLVHAVTDKDETVRCMAFESLEQLRRSKHKDLRDEADRLMQGVEARCGG